MARRRPGPANWPTANTAVTSPPRFPTPAPTPQGGTWHDNGDAQSYIGYLSRGWWQNNVSHLKTQMNDYWKPTSCVGVDWWSGHDNGKNLLFQDGHSKFGDAPIGGITAESWFTTFTGTGGTGSVGLWNYYETGVP